MATSNNIDIKLYLPAEWHEQSGVQLTWPHAKTDWAPILPDITKVFVELTRAIAKHEKVLIVASDTDEVKATLMRNLGMERLRNVLFHQCETNDTWARDHAAITLTGNNTNNGFKVQNTLLDFKFNGWGEKFAADKDNAITQSLYHEGMLNGTLESHNDFVLEGGALESDGKGTVFTTSQCLLAPHRNQPMTKDDIEQRLKDTLRAEHVVWLDHGNLVGDDTDGHIDTIVRIAPENTLLYVGCDDSHDEQFEDFLALEHQLMSLRTSTGMPYRLLRLPMPDAIYDEGERLPATYANFLIINGAVICPTYAQPEKDKQALQTIAQAYLDREIIGIDARTVIKQHGSLHCLTMQFPQGVIANNP